ncbi:methyl-accepting chemotaxis protein [Leptospira bandrabouensis]|uniref:methyl-accepting chemotaxis protein n=1 Tax=Leptospira bandrabouensis TaxID=2484903 RepID=UPI001EE7B726|nr:methyl-accepting chemotaxis protein [Leptospira bandrabouensis]MCG6142973.1 methyl-accepting chemotaxis protein [Leptospira bandrabouensis]MCG6158632.1 methyl-accepting chemotaxis protein [Leptospira bandrabouensis]MCG6162568.1 methyl-accepting chemotaxis protein [Leptospira bandrabouensis]
MKNVNVNLVENVLNESDVIISRTDTKGLITYVSPDFARISEYSVEEMIGKPHNIVRHPDMPKLVFEEMWGFMKVGLPWTGAVKNRAKSGNYYWVDATITPILNERRQVIGYVSVRKKLAEEKKEYFEKLYKKLGQKSSLLRKKKKISKNIRSVKFHELLFVLLSSLPFLSLLFLQMHEKPLFCGSLLLIQTVIASSFIFVLAQKNKKLQKATESVISVSSGRFQYPDHFHNDSRDEVKIMLLSMKSMSINLWGIVSQIQKATDVSIRISKELTDLTNHFFSSTHSMASGSEEAAACMEELTSALDNIKQITASHSVIMSDMKDYMNAVNQNLKGTQNALKGLDDLSTRSTQKADAGKQKISESLEGMENIKQVSSKILNIVSIISEIADRTNLLSLNASIEAARAGHFGAGFAIVAKEMMGLNEQIAVSVEEIKNYIDETLSVIKETSVKVNEASMEVFSVADLFSEMKSILKKVAASLYHDLQESTRVKLKLDSVEDQVKQIDQSVLEANLASKQISDILLGLSEQAQVIAYKSETLQEKSSLVVTEPKKIMELVEHYHTGETEVLEVTS